jgi:disulfide bond formation protein DsbB
VNEVGEVMRRSLRPRFWVESTLGAISAILFLITLVWSDWIELVFKVDPDRGNGSLEWAIVAVLAVAAICVALLARAEWRRAQPVLSAGGITSTGE